jgi:cell wall assembly regulator SMI1
MDFCRLKIEVIDMLRLVKPLGIEKINISGATLKDVTDFERRHGLRAPTELKEWLLMCNGAEVNPGGIFPIEPTVMGSSIDRLLRREPNWVRKGWVPIAGDGCGDYYVMSALSKISGQETSPIFFVDQSNYNFLAYVVGSSLWHFLWFLLNSELRLQVKRPVYWPFNKSWVLRKDPAIIYCTDAELPWNTT